MATSQNILLSLLSVVVLVDGGVVRELPEKKIVGGSKIDISEVPWQISLLLNNNHICGGSIISRQWVLTAAHCTFEYRVSELMIRAGSKSNLEGGKLYKVKKVVNHKKYNSVAIINDISVLKTKMKMKFDLLVNAVTLPVMGTKRPSIGTKLRVSGWGEIDNGKYPALLMAVDVVLRDYKDCLMNKDRHDPTQICAGAPGKDACFGDSGGPLVKGNLLVGVVSYGVNEACGSLPGAYTDVAAYRDWIKKRTGA